MDDWVVKLRADALKPGQRFVFAEEFGGEGEVLTVERTMDEYGIVEVYTEELDFALVFKDRSMVTLRGAPDEDDEWEGEEG